MSPNSLAPRSSRGAGPGRAVERVAAALLAAALGAGVPTRASADSPPAQVVVADTRVRLGDLIPGAPARAAAVDVGPAPAAGASRLVTRGDIVAALEAGGVTSQMPLPEAVRVVRKTRHLSPAEVDALVGDAVRGKNLGRGVSLASVRANRAADVADGWTRVEVDVPRAPKRAGRFATTGVASFFSGGDVLARVAVPLELSISEEGAGYDLPRGAAVTLVIRRTFVEVRAGGFAAADADVGDVVPVQLRPSGRIVRARLIDKDEALALETGR